MLRPDAVRQRLEASVGWRRSAVSLPALRAALGNVGAGRGDGDRSARPGREPFDDIVHELAVSESWFFREPRSLAHAVRHAREVARSRPARLVSLPCAAGEEPYSLVLAALRAGLEPAALEVWGVDLSTRALACAREAVYGPRAFREPGYQATLRAGYFEPEGERWRLRGPARDSVRFLAANALDPSWVDRVPPVDVLLCRNLLIYLTDAARNTVLLHAARALRPDGLLIVAAAEAGLLVGSPHFQRASQAPVTVLCRRVAADQASGVGSRPAFCPGRFGAPAGTPSAPHGARRATARGATARPHRPEPAPQTTQHVPPAASVGALPRARELADSGRLAEAEEMLRRVTESASLDAEPHLLLGAVLAARGDTAGAVASLRRALYLDPGDDLARAHLAHLCAQVGTTGARDRPRFCAGGGRP